MPVISAAEFADAKNKIVECAERLYIAERRGHDLYNLNRDLAMLTAKLMLLTQVANGNMPAWGMLTRLRANELAELSVTCEADEKKVAEDKERIYTEMDGVITLP